MSRLATVIDEVVLANRALDHGGVLVAHGHVSARHPELPDRFLLSWSKSPGLVEANDVIAFDLRGEPVEADDRPLYVERFIRAGIFHARPDVGGRRSQSRRGHAAVRPRQCPLRPVIHSASNMAGPAPVWDIRDRFGDTDLLVSDLAQADDLAATLGAGSVALMSGHGFVVAASTLIEAVRLATYTQRTPGSSRPRYAWAARSVISVRARSARACSDPEGRKGLPTIPTGRRSAALGPIIAIASAVAAAIVEDKEQSFLTSVVSLKAIIFIVEVIRYTEIAEFQRKKGGAFPSRFGIYEERIADTFHQELCLSCRVRNHMYNANAALKPAPLTGNQPSSDGENKRADVAGYE